MTCIRDLLSILPNIILYLASGYAFVQTFRFVALKERKQEINHLLTSSLVIGYVIVNIMNLIPFTISYQADCVGIIITSVIASFLFSKFYMSDLLYRILKRLHIYTTTKDHFWMNFVDFDYPSYVKIQMKDNTIYSGYYYFMEGYDRQPLISLAAYRQVNPNGDIENHQTDETSVILLDTKDAKSVQFVYYDRSRKCVDIKDLISNHNEYGSPTYSEFHTENDR